MTDEQAKGVEKNNQVVLVVDGRPSRQFYTSIFLQRLHYDVIMAKTAEDALVYLDMTVPLAIITDIDLPGMDGIELLQRIKKKQRTFRVPVLIYSKRGDPETQEACRQAGCAGFIVHPCSLDRLYLAVQNATEERPRRFIRRETSLELAREEGAPGGAAASDGRITDISEDGMFISTAKPLPYGSVHPFAFFLPNAPGWVVRVEGEVRFIHDGSDPVKQPGMGVKFLTIGDRERELVRNYVNDYLTEVVAADRPEGDEGSAD